MYCGGLGLQKLWHFPSLFLDQANILKSSYQEKESKPAIKQLQSLNVCPRKKNILSRFWTISKGIRENASVSQHKQFEAQASLLLWLRDLERWLKQGDACPQSSDPIRPCHAPLTQQRYSVFLKTSGDNYLPAGPLWDGLKPQIRWKWFKMGKGSDIITQNLGPVDQQGVKKGKCSQGNTITLVINLHRTFLCWNQGL